MLTDVSDAFAKFVRQSTPDIRDRNVDVQESVLVMTRLTSWSTARSPHEDSDWKVHGRPIEGERVKHVDDSTWRKEVLPQVRVVA